MSHSELVKLQQTLRELYQLIQGDTPETALSRVEFLLKRWPSQPDVAHLAALAYKNSNKVGKAKSHFLKSLQLNPKQPQVLNNYANFLKSHGDYALAIQNYLLAINIQPSFFDAIRNLGLCYYASEDFAKAELQLIASLKLKGEDLVALTTLANCYRKTDRLKAAKETYLKVLSIDSKYVNALYNLGLAHYLDKETEQAIALYELAYQQTRTSDIVTGLASILHEVGRTADATLLLNKELDLDPFSVALHECLNGILWEAGLTSEFGNSYRKVIASGAVTEELYVSYISQLHMVAKLNQAETQLFDAIQRFGQSARLLAIRAKLFADHGRYKDAYGAFSESLRKDFTIETAQQMIKLCIIQEKYSKAQNLIDRVFESRPECQLNWALQGQVWVLLGDARATWLNDYERFIGVYQLPVPKSYDSLGEYLYTLKDVLLSQHLNNREPLRQTLKSGTQTPPRLFHDKTPEVMELVVALNSIVAKYIDSLPNDDNHPFLRRKKHNFKFSGSWSVKLKTQGFHVNHVHPEGWISSSCYISLPEQMHSSESSLEGALKFGESPMMLGEREWIAKTVTPKEGMVVLFPSYFWHGTYPFLGGEEEYRLTTPFDVLPD